MFLIIAISIIVFAAVFYIMQLAYPHMEKQAVVYHKKKIDSMAPKLDEMFLDVPVTKLILLDILSPLVCGLLAYGLAKKPVAGFIGAAIGFIIPFIVIRILQAKRRKKFLAQLVDAIMILSSSLKVGMSLQQAFEVLVQEMPAPIAQEFSLMLRQVQMGFSIDRALEDLKKRMRLDELDIIVTSLMVAKETGGDITEALSKVAYTITERNKIIGKVKALTIQAKLQGIIMSIIPIAFGAFIYKTDPTFFDVFFKDNFGRMILGYAIVSQILGMYFIMKLSKVDV